MREHMGLYRGKRIDNGEWVEGWYCKAPMGRWPLKHCIIPNIEAEGGCFRYIEVDPETVDECTGLRDKNGKLIFEGDIVRAPNGHISEVVYWCGRFCQYCYCHEMHTDSVHADILEVVGNIHEL